MAKWPIRRKRVMPVSKRVIFTPEVLDKIPHWVDAGATPDLIAEALGSTVASLTVTCSKHGISLKGPGRLDGALRRELPAEIWDIINIEAVEYDTTVVELVVRLLEVISRDDLFKAVLDDNNRGSSQ